MTTKRIPRNRSKDGRGKSDLSYQKHFAIKKLLGPQVAILSMKFGRGGLIVDMHAGDGDGVETPQIDFFGANASEGTAGMAVHMAQTWGSTAVLCESNPHRRDHLRTQFDAVEILPTHNAIPARLPISDYAWVVVLNDPNGHSRHGVDVLIHIARANHRSDFIICLNEGSLSRHLGVGEETESDTDHSNERLIRGCREARDQYAWMADRDEWRTLLRKRHGASARYLCGNGAYRGRVMLFSNFIGNINNGMFEQW